MEISRRKKSIRNNNKRGRKEFGKNTIHSQHGFRQPTRPRPQPAEFRVKKVHLHTVFWAYISDATQIHLTPGRFRLGAAFPSRSNRRLHVPRRLDPSLQPASVQPSQPVSVPTWNLISRRGWSAQFVSSAGRHEVAIPHRLFMSWFRPASLTACPPREPPPLFEQEHRNAEEPTPRFCRLELDELGLGACHGRGWGDVYMWDFSRVSCGCWVSCFGHLAG